LRNYFVGALEDEENIVLGNFHLEWNANTDFHKMVYNSCLAFQILYKLNYSLWKATDLQTAVKKNNEQI
jgi:hypothetical protein